MNISAFSDYLNSQNIPLYTLVILFAIFLAIVIFLFIVIIYLYKKVRKLTIIRYGFGGKPIFSIFVLFALVVFLPFTMYSVHKSVEYINYANATKDALLSIYIDQKALDLYSVSFTAVPMINGKPWGDKVYDVTWNIQGVVTFEKIEKNGI
jgi:hypothetical protein